MKLICGHAWDVVYLVMARDMRSELENMSLQRLHIQFVTFAYLDVEIMFNIENTREY